jgi:hypothetical protein
MRIINARRKGVHAWVLTGVYKHNPSHDTILDVSGDEALNALAEYQVDEEGGVSNGNYELRVSRKPLPGFVQVSTIYSNDGVIVESDVIAAVGWFCKEGIKSVFGAAIPKTFYVDITRVGD